MGIRYEFLNSLKNVLTVGLLPSESKEVETVSETMTEESVGEKEESELETETESEEEEPQNQKKKNKKEKTMTIINMVLQEPENIVKEMPNVLPQNTERMVIDSGLLGNLDSMLH